jgi:hypothetical protein
MLLATRWSLKTGKRHQQAVTNPTVSLVKYKNGAAEGSGLNLRPISSAAPFESFFSDVSLYGQFRSGELRFSMNDDASVGQSFSRQGHIVRTYRDASWWLKLDRAEKHLVELNDAIAAYESRRLHEVSKRVESKRKPNEWVYRLAIRGNLDDRWAIIAGDYLSCVRAALDHMMVALQPPKYRRDLIYFPISECNPWERVKGGRAYVTRDPSSRRAFLTALEHVKPDAAAFIKGVQPYQHGSRTSEHVLLTLRRLNNADKHRKLLVQEHGLTEGVRRFLLPPNRTRVQDVFNIAAGHALADGAEIHRLPFEVDMKVHGTAKVAIGSSAEHVCELRDTFEALFQFVSITIATLELWVS